MKQYIFIILLSIQCIIITQSQTISMDMVIKCGDTLISHSILDNTKIEYVKKNRMAYVIIHNSPIDTIEIMLWRVLPIISNHKIYFNVEGKDDNKYKKLIYSLPNKKVESYDYVFNYDNGITQLYVTNEANTRLFLFNPETQEKILFADFDDIIQSTIGANDVMVSFFEILFINKECAYVALCYDDGSSGDGCSGYKSFLVYKSGRKVDITNKLPLKVGNNERLTNHISRMNFVSSDGKYIQENSYYEIFANPSRSGKVNRLFDDQFNYISDLLLFEPQINGINVQQGTLQNYFLKSYIDADDPQKRTFSGFSPAYVIIPYKFNPTLELSMYKAYNNTLLTPNDLKGLGKYELGILRNLIFAKYNYEFNSEFYQAYFNLYEFYGGIYYGNEKKRKSRVKDVSNMLTDIDKTNIKMIREAELLFR